MSIEIVHVVTVKCDAIECDHGQVCGESERYAEQTGWRLAIPIGDKLFDLCPNCVIELDNFVSFLLDPEMDLKKILADEQPYPEDVAND